MTAQQSNFENVLEAKVLEACSSLTTFSCELDNGQGIVLEAVEAAGGNPAIKVSLVESAALPKDSDAVCRVDWSWIYGSAIKKLVTTSGAAKFELSEAGPLTISVQTWQGKPFLAFQPYKPAK